MMPKISFLFPLRWLTDKQDREFLEKNLHRQIEHRVGADNMELLLNVFAYKATLVLYSYMPSKTPLTAPQLEKLLHPILQGKCMSLEYDFVQTKSKTMSPACELKLFF